ncbi:uncharacterized protein EI90DRAFT_1947422 [Cantharellus anzutake]|uniref:uncharacterized protein n=1 Tax=Cantharellus anzutake TaxID=1750568 RepID=UPI001904F8BB|nr:uncharacterized protein EI90DRAFT_1947422 [Cantharellus anzutake]KAF8326383.1 hypothetical protein EI90DRAFT_1947422 [Cantharellus anzutake]
MENVPQDIWETLKHRCVDIGHSDEAAEDLVWRDIPVWTHSRSPFMELPVEILDKITDPGNGLSLSDYLAISGVCREIRGLFTADVWEKLHRLYMGVRMPTLLIFENHLNHIRRTNITFLNTIWSSGWLAIRNGEIPTFNCGDTSYKSEVLRMLDFWGPTCQQIDLLSAVDRYGLTPLEGKILLCDPRKRLIHDSAGDWDGWAIRLPPNYTLPEAKVRRLAYMAHGGPRGHAEHMRKIYQHRRYSTRNL